MTTEIHTDSTIFKHIAAEWNQLVEKSLTPHVFLTTDFLEGWWKTLGSGELQILTVRDEQEFLQGIFPFFRTNESDKKTLHLLGCKNVSDYLDVLIDTKYADEVYAVLEEVLAQSIEWDRLSICSIPEHSRTRAHLKHFSKKHNYRCTETIQDVTPQIQLPQTWENYLSQLRRKDRHEIRRKEKKLFSTEPTARVEVLTAKNQVSEFLPEFIRLHKLSSQDKNDFWDDTHISFFTETVPALAGNGWVKLYVLSIAEQPIATMLIFDYNNHYELYNSGFDPQFYPLSPGMVLIGHTIRDAIEQGREVYDFLRGDKKYKFRFGAEAKEVFDIDIGKNT